MNNKKIGKILIWIASSVIIVGIYFIQPIPQDLAYHNFIDGKTVFGIDNFSNVVSNLPFLLVGIWGIFKLNKLTILHELEFVYWILLVAVIMVSFGSGYYHLDPSNHTLVWDRLPMTIAFMSLFSIVISEFLNERSGALLLFPFLVIGALSVFYWQQTDDLRLYVLVQFLPVVVIPIIITFFPTEFVKATGYWSLLISYVIAKILEYYDSQIYDLTGQFMSGHAIKHIVAAFGLYLLLRYYSERIRIYKMDNNSA